MTREPRLTLSTYKPNLKDPRVRSKATSALAWCADKLIGSKRPKPLHSNEIREVLGNANQPGLAQWLRANLLTRVSGHYEPGKQNCLYALNRTGYERIHSLLGLEVPDDLDVFRRKFANVLDGKPIEYSDNGLRRYHEFLNIRREDRGELCRGWWDYDIETCAPTLVSQYAVEHYRKRVTPGQAKIWPPDNPLPAVRRMIEDKVAVREHIATLVGADIATAKELLMLLFFRAHPAPRRGNPFFSALGCDQFLLDKLLNDPFVKELRLNIARMWGWAFSRQESERLDLWFSRRRLVNPPKKRGSRQSRLYQSMERQVMDVIEQQLKTAGISTILVHDGFMCRVQVDREGLVRAVKDQTGFEIRLSEALLGGSAKAEDDEPDLEKLIEGWVCEDDLMHEEVV